MNPTNSPEYPWKSPAWIDRSDRARLWVSGADRARFLHNLTTNDVKKLGVGAGREAFVTSLQGKTLAFVIMHVTQDKILVRADPGGLEYALPHFQKYGALDDVTLEDVSASTCELHLIGPWPDFMGFVLGADYSHLSPNPDPEGSLQIRESPTGFPGLTVIGPISSRNSLVTSFHHAGISPIEGERFEALRILAGTPLFGREVTPANLPQELGRDDRAISFVKGCYLGQETVARIDAVGHVNRVLKGLRFDEGDAPPAVGSPIHDQGKAVGMVTSSARSPFDGGPIALAFLKTSHAHAGMRLAVPSPGSGEPAWGVVADLPMKPENQPDR